jgi:hypothetical protein
MQDHASIKIHPLDLSEYGLNPAGKPIYRVVWADSRVEKFEHEGKMHQVPLYAGKADGKWVMEKWLSSEDFYGMNREQFAEIQRQMGVGMEFAADGTYELCTGGGGIFPGEVTPRLAHLWASQINCDQTNHTDAERALALREAYEESAKAAEKKKDEVIMNALERTHA